MNSLWKYCIAFCCLVFWYSCQNEEDLPDIPSIAFQNIQLVFNDDLGIYDRAVIVFSYEDGNGDIGLYDSDTVPPYDYNLFVDFYEKQNGEWKKVVLSWYNPENQKWDSLNMNGRIPLLTPKGNYKAIKGEIYDTVFAYNFHSSFDTIRYTVSIRDRALNQSNTIESSALVVPRHTP